MFASPSLVFALILQVTRATYPLHNPPPTSPPLLDSTPDRSTLQRLVPTAGDEILASEMLRTPALNASQRALTPNLKHVIRDKPHSSRRLVSRPFAADGFLGDVVTMMARGRDSMARLIHDSLEVKRIFGNFVDHRASPIVSSALKNMRAAGHRFESYQKPLGRTCLHLHNVIRTAMAVAADGPGDAKGRAKTWLSGLDTEKALQAAMLADATDEAMQWTRILDSEDADPAELVFHAQQFRRAIEALFVADPPNCISVFGYTRVVLDLLKTPIVWTIDGMQKSIGNSQGCPAAVLQACIGRMRNWVTLATATINAEFPAFELSQAAAAGRPLQPRSWQANWPAARPVAGWPGGKVAGWEASLLRRAGGAQQQPAGHPLAGHPAGP